MEMETRVIVMPEFTEAQKQQGQELIDLLEEKGFAIDAAAWIFGIEWEEWRLLLAFRDFSALKGMLPLLVLIHELRKPEWTTLANAVIHPVSPKDPIIRDLRAMLKRVRMTDANRWTLKNRIHDLSIEKGWLYRLYPAETTVAPS